MKANNNKRAVTVGIFIVLGLAIFIAGILTLGGQKKTFEKKVQVKAVFDDVGGLMEGNNVWFSGVKVGTIKKMSFAGNSQVEVVMSIEKNAQEFIKKDAKAKISSEGFIGNKIVVLYGGTVQAGPIADDDLLAVEKGLSTDDILAIPTLVRRSPAPLRKIIGDLSDRDRVLAGLHLQPRPGR